MVARWAGIVVTSQRTFQWTRIPAEKTVDFDTVAEARDYLRLRLHIMTRPGAGYSVLPSKVRIMARASIATRRAGSAARVKATTQPTPKRRPSATVRMPHAIRRAISIRQPLVELILRGIKKWEFRSQPTVLRERVFLYASNKPFEDDRRWKQVGKSPGMLPTGSIVGSVEIADCKQTSDGGFKYRLVAPRRMRPHLKATNQPQPRFWIPKF